MADFKLLGGTDPVNQSLGVMTQGLGFPLREVEPAVSGGAVTVVVQNALSADSFVDQDPVGLGTPMRVSFGDAQANEFFSLAADGTLTVLQGDEYTFRVKLTVGREGAGGESQLYTRVMYNGVQAGVSNHAIIDSARLEFPLVLEGVLPLVPGDELWIELARDLDGTDSGGLRAGTPDLVGWTASPSARLTINRFVAVTP